MPIRIIPYENVVGPPCFHHFCRLNDCNNTAKINPKRSKNTSKWSTYVPNWCPPQPLNKRQTTPITKNDAQIITTCTYYLYILSVSLSKKYLFTTCVYVVILYAVTFKKKWGYFDMTVESIWCHLWSHFGDGEGGHITPSLLSTFIGKRF